MAVSISQRSRTDTWAIDIRYLTIGGKPLTLTGHGPTYHAGVFFLAAASNARVLLGLLNPSGVGVYVAVYTGCVLAGLVLGAAIRRQHNDRLSRMASAGLGSIGFTGPALLLLLAVHARADAPAAAGYVPLTAALLVALSTLVAKLLTVWFPAGETEPAPLAPVAQV